MFELMVESRAGAALAGRRLALPVAAGLHGLAIAALVTASLLALEGVSDPDRFLWSDVTLIRPGTSIPPLEGDGGAPVRTPAPRPPAPQESPREPVQPVEVRPLPEQAAPAESEIESGAVTGLPGIEGTIPGLRPGVPWGVPWGEGTGPPGNGGEGASEGVAPAPFEPVPLSPDMRPPGIVHRVRPEYPAIALRARLEGHVVLQAVVGERGDVEDVEVLRASSEVFAAPAIEAVRHWRYRPALQNGRPVRVYFTVRVDFRLE